MVCITVKQCTGWVMVRLGIKPALLSGHQWLPIPVHLCWIVALPSFHDQMNAKIVQPPLASQWNQFFIQFMFSCNWTVFCPPHLISVLAPSSALLSLLSVLTPMFSMLTKLSSMLLHASEIVCAWNFAKLHWGSWMTAMNSKMKWPLWHHYGDHTLKTEFPEKAFFALNWQKC